MGRAKKYATEEERLEAIRISKQKYEENNKDLRKEKDRERYLRRKELKSLENSEEITEDDETDPLEDEEITKKSTNKKVAQKKTNPPRGENRIKNLVSKKITQNKIKSSSEDEIATKVISKKIEIVNKNLQDEEKRTSINILGGENITINICKNSEIQIILKQ